ncbi:transporter substrate-binding domain-containing protein [Adlercreutzia sp. R21]|uniref:Transporter substrate-binding domain-containing protein n=1 Tax=Adlercreutzia wanghongyangiae TaxID=3111451 RepID=A0ABU6IFR7_9ACTN|nr:transporter substrate-binding domain-containing protein [Adlercreutzia sp. R21]MEC4175285.1 transporter substrate-binding domain-containing protein [Adlercreutzia sp. R7]MEC4185341.1 transporter substrate-binding domain-containing protein [Adlercreutzia sp. R21]
MKKMTKIAAVVASLALGVALLAGCSSAGDTATDGNAADNATNPDAPTLTVGFDAAYPPYGFLGDDGNYVGFDLDLAAEVAERNGWNLQLEPIDWDAKDALLNQGTINCIWNGFTMEGREDGYSFSDPYMLNEQVVVVRADSDIKSLEDLAGKNVMTQVDSAALDVLEDEEGQKALADTFAGGAAQTIGDYNNAFMQLESGAVDAVACDLSIADYQMAAKPDMFVKLDPLSTEHYAVGFAKDGDAAMIDAVNKTLKEMYDDGTIAELCEKWGEYGITIDNWVLVD